MRVANYKQQLVETIAEHQRIGIAEQIDYKKFCLYSIITHSTAIEGSAVTETENQLLFDEGITGKSRSIQEYMMNLDLKAAYVQAMVWAKDMRTVDSGMLKALSALVMKNTGSVCTAPGGTFDSSQGDLRLVNVNAGAGGRSYMNFQEVPLRLEEFCLQMGKRRQSVLATDVFEQYLLSFDAHYQLVTIHPWVDGNGRMARLLMNYIQFGYGLIPVNVMKDDKHEYIRALVDARESGSSDPFREVMLKIHIRNLKQEIETFKKCMEHDFTFK